jgi:hypothetical protein
MKYSCNSWKNLKLLLEVALEYRTQREKFGTQVLSITVDMFYSFNHL